MFFKLRSISSEHRWMIYYFKHKYFVCQAYDSSIKFFFFWETYLMFQNPSSVGHIKANETIHLDDTQTRITSNRKPMTRQNRGTRSNKVNLTPLLPTMSIKRIKVFKITWKLPDKTIIGQQINRGTRSFNQSLAQLFQSACTSRLQIVWLSKNRIHLCTLVGNP